MTTPAKLVELTYQIPEGTRQVDDVAAFLKDLRDSVTRAEVELAIPSLGALFGHTNEMVPQPATHSIRYSYAEYVAFESASNVKHEFLDGHIYAMAGGTPDHAALAASAIGLLFPQLRDGKCRVLDSDLRLRNQSTGLATYPDVTVVCGRRELDSEDPNAVVNPTLIIEVTSKTSEGYDRGEKFEHYKQISTLRQYVLVSHRERLVEVWTRNHHDWILARYTENDVADLATIGGKLAVRELYEAAAEPRL